MTYWQIAAGDGTVDLVDIFLKLIVALIGPGNEGDYFDNKRLDNWCPPSSRIIRMSKVERCF